MAPPTPTSVQVSPYQTPQQRLAAQALMSGTPGIDLGALLGAGNALGGLGATPAAAPAVGAVGATAAPAAGRFAGLGKAGTVLASPVGRAGLYGAGGVAAGQIANKLVGEHNQSSNDEALTGALTGAGVGAGLGSLVLPGVGTAVGAGAGALLGGALGKFGPKDKGVGPADAELQKQLASVDELAARAGLNADARMSLALQLQSARTGVASKSEMKAAGAQVAALIPQIQLQAQADTQQQTRAMYVQAALAPLLATHLQRAGDSARNQQAMLEQAAGAVQGPLADAYRARAGQLVADTDLQNAALAQQALLAGMPGKAGQQQLLQQLLGAQQQAATEAAAKGGSKVKDIGQFITGTGVTDNLVQLYTMKMLMGAKAGRMSPAGGI